MRSIRRSRGSWLAATAAAAIAAATLAGCAAPAEVGVNYAATPSLSYVAPGVYAVSDVETPWFFADGWYWAFDDGLWYRAPYIGGPRVRVSVVPPGLAHVSRPWGFAHYHPRVVAHAPQVAGHVAVHRR